MSPKEEFEETKKRITPSKKLCNKVVKEVMRMGNTTKEKPYEWNIPKLRKLAQDIKKCENDKEECKCIGCSNGERCTKEIRIDIVPEVDNSWEIEARHSHWFIGLTQRNRHFAEESINFIRSIREEAKKGEFEREYRAAIRDESMEFDVNRDVYGIGRLDGAAETKKEIEKLRTMLDTLIKISYKKTSAEVIGGQLYAEVKLIREKINLNSNK